MIRVNRFLSAATKITTTTTINCNGKRHVAGICSGSMVTSSAILTSPSSFDIRVFYRQHCFAKNHLQIIRSYSDQNPTKMSSDEQLKAQQASDDGGETIFGKMLNGKIPAKFIYEDDLVGFFHCRYWKN